MNVIHDENACGQLKLSTLKRSRETVILALKRSRLGAETLPLSIYACIYLYKRTCSGQPQAVNNGNKSMIKSPSFSTYPLTKKTKGATMKPLFAKRQVLTTINSFLMTAFLSSPVFAQMDPATNAANKMKTILFGGLGTSLCAILLGATFILAKTGKITWDKFIFLGFCTAGFLGAPSIVTLIKGWV
jgi:type IV secretory pathway VirB2 component (pilin)